MFRVGRAVFGPETSCLIVYVLGGFGHGGTFCFVFLSYLHYLICIHVYVFSKQDKPVCT